MAPKDYVSRGRATKKAPPPPSPSLPWVRIVVTLVLVLGFVGFLWTIKDKGVEPTETVSEKQQQKPAEEDELPVMTEEEWEFIKTLPEYSVEVETREQKTRERPYLMQCGSFRREDQAQEMKAKIAFLGLVAQVKPSDGSSGRWHRVILGPYTSKRDAEKDRHAIRRSGIRTCRIWDW
ncbi:cell division protein FtsN [Alteromonadaceae bacterium M269]|nr:cell division protein FtsN [Alteromonadaceae bacterium M269]